MSEHESLSLEKLRIDERLRAVELQLAKLVSHSESEYGNSTRNLDAVTKITEKLSHIVLGNGTAGLVEKVNNHERFLASLKQSSWLIITAVIGLLVNAVWEVITK